MYDSATETALIEYLLEKLRNEKGMTLDEIASKVYGGENLPQSRLKLYRLRKPQKDGKTKKLTLSDFVAICEALEVDPVRVLAKNLDKI